MVVSSSLLTLALLCWASTTSLHAFAPARTLSTTTGSTTTTRRSNGRIASPFVTSAQSTSAETDTDTEKDSSSSSMFFASVQETTTSAPPTTPDTSHSPTQVQTRQLGSQENLMLPRQYNVVDGVTFPPMNHVAAVQLSATPCVEALRQAVAQAARVHPLLRAHVQGDGQPERRIDLFQMVREGDPNPCTFVASVDDPEPPHDLASRVVSLVPVPNDDDKENYPDALQASWQAAFRRDLDDGSWCGPPDDGGPLWKLELHAPARAATQTLDDQPCVLLFSFNHAISDQSSVNRLVDQLLTYLAANDEDNADGTPVYRNNPMPVSLEESVLGKNQAWKDVGPAGLSLQTASYVAGKAAEGLRNPVILPETAQVGGGPLGALSIIAGQTAGGTDDESRQSVLAFRKLDAETVQALVKACRDQGVSVSNVLTAAATYTASDFIAADADSSRPRQRNYKILQSLDMRRFGAQLDKGETVACMAGSHDLMHGPLEDMSGQSLRKNPTPSKINSFWTLAQEGKAQTQDFVATNGPSEAVRVFDFAMTIADLNNLVYLTAQSKDTKGRAYSAGVTNVGVYEKQEGFPLDDASRPALQPQHGKYRVQDIYFATPHTQSGCLFQVSGMTLDGQLRLTFNPVSPIVSHEISEKFADAFVELLQIVAGTKEVPTLPPQGEASTTMKVLQENGLPLLTLILGAVAVASHAPAWASFYQSVMEMKANVAPEEFWPALNFWIFFAVGHPILQPILWISDVLHGTPGPMVGGLVPVLFIAGNAAVIAAISFSKQIRNSVNVAALAAFFTYVGAGLSGTAGLGDFNLALDDSYNGQVVKGCPAYEEVRQTSMDDFDLKKYQGLWYEQKFHDWTQFKEVYDTSLNIKLTEDGDGWIDDFAVKGPAPKSAPLSWDKSPVANGAHYFLFGRVDKNDPPGILREKGFGVEFPNYIVDVKKDPVTGEYREAIQFQCLERGGVRVFEGINFMSRNPTMTDEEIAAMHARAQKAGMFPYGASPEQMHQVARRPIDGPAIDNNWQQMWKAIGVDKLLELLTESIEDGGR